MSGDRILEAVRGALAAEPETVAVLGDSASARRLRERLKPQLAGPEVQPQVVIEMSGEPERIASALEGVDDLGVVFLAGPPPTEPVALDLYSDLHVRGLRMIGLGPAAGEDA